MKITLIYIHLTNTNNNHMKPSYSTNQIKNIYKNVLPSPNISILTIHKFSHLQRYPLKGKASTAELQPSHGTCAATRRVLASSARMPRARHARRQLSLSARQEQPGRGIPRALLPRRAALQLLQLKGLARASRIDAGCSFSRDVAAISGRGANCGRLYARRDQRTRADRLSSHSCGKVRSTGRWGCRRGCVGGAKGCSSRSRSVGVDLIDCWIGC